MSRLGRLRGRFYDRLRDSEARSAATAALSSGALDALKHHQYCLVVSYRRSGEAVPTPVWFAIEDGRLLFLSDAEAAKLKRIRANSRVRVAPCTARGKPLGPPIEATARLLESAEDQQRAKRAIEAKYQPGDGRIYQRLLAPLLGSIGGRHAVYVEVSPVGLGPSVRGQA
jgi:PPOX class probable F420-dependent enzyme